MRPWVTFFSQTGSEIYNISEKLGRYPDIIICNKPKDDLSINLNLLMHTPNSIVYVESRPKLEDYYDLLPKNAFVTLHGWLRIIPKEICERYEIYNLHPANLAHNPELKGKDPQKMAYDKKLIFSGNTIHRCTAELDAGEILEHSYISIEGLSIDEVFVELHKDATNLWFNFLKKHL
jgi:methionyl-tRNA formyltransferase